MHYPGHFDLIARYYDRLIGGVDDEGELAELLEPAFTGVSGQADPGRTAGHAEHAWLLDMGGGTGRVAQRLGGGGRRLLVCDLSLAMARQARAKGLDVVQCSVDRLPFATGSVAGLFVVDAFHHFTYPAGEATQRQAAAEMARVLRERGRLIVQEPDIRWNTVKLIALGEKLLLMRSRFHRPANLAGLFESAGLRTVEIRESGFSAQVVLERDA